MRILILVRSKSFRDRIQIIIEKKILNAELTFLTNARSFLFYQNDKKYDLLIIDMDMLDESQLGKIRNQLKRSNKHKYILGLTLFNEIFFPLSYFKFGADGYLSKDCRETEFLQTIKKLLAGGKHIDDNLNQLLADYISHRKNNKFQFLSNKELLIVQEITKGKSLYQIASLMNSTKPVIEKLYKSLLRKLDIEKQSIPNLITLVSEYYPV